MEKDSDSTIAELPQKQKATWVTLRFLIALLLFFTTLLVFVEIAHEIVLEHNNTFDQKISQAIEPYVSPIATSFMTAITFFGSSDFLFPAYLVIIAYYFIRKKSRLALDIVMIGLSSTAILFLFKDIFKRTRPLDPLIQNVTGFSFPSGHSFSSFTFYGLLIYMLSKAAISNGWKVIISLLLFALATTIAFSRVYLRVHYPSDVVAGFCLSVIWMMIALWLLHKADRELVAPKKKL